MLIKDFWKEFESDRVLSNPCKEFPRARGTSEFSFPILLIHICTINYGTRREEVNKNRLCVWFSFRLGLAGSKIRFWQSPTLPVASIGIHSTSFNRLWQQSHEPIDAVEENRLTPRCSYIEKSINSKYYYWSRALYKIHVLDGWHACNVSKCLLVTDKREIGSCTFVLFWVKYSRVKEICFHTCDLRVPIALETAKSLIKAFAGVLRNHNSHPPLVHDFLWSD